MFYFVCLTDFDADNEEFQDILNNPMFISALDSQIGDCFRSDPLNVNRTDEQLVNNESVTLNPVGLPAIEKIRIPISMASPTSIYSSSSESSSTTNIKKHRKRICKECNRHFKHTAEWLSHLKTHIKQPKVSLVPISEKNSYYIDYLHRNSKTKRRSSTDSGSLRIKIKIPRNESSVANESNGINESEDGAALNSISEPRTKSQRFKDLKSNESINEAVNDALRSNNECRIRVLRAEEIKQSPPRAPMKDNFPADAMVTLPVNENRIHYECPILDGLNQFSEGPENEESAEQILKHLLETPSIPPEMNDFVPSEFISIDRLAHTCTVCNLKFTEFKFLDEHQRNTGHGMSENSVSRAPSTETSILEPIQAMTVDQNRQYCPPQTTHLERILNRQMPPQMPVYGQPRVLPLRQMENQVANFSMIPNIVRAPAQPSNYQLPRIALRPQQQMMRPITNQLGQPLNMTPFLGMNPDMYHPRQQTNSNEPNQLFMRQPSNFEMMNRFMQKAQRLPIHRPQVPTHRPQLVRSSLQTHQGQIQNRAPPPYPMRPNNQPAYQSRNPNSTQQQPRMNLSQFDPPNISQNGANRPNISNAPRAEGLPVIESVQSGAILMNSTKKSDTNQPIQLNDHLTLSVKNKESTGNTNDRRSTPPTVDSNKVANILANRGITVKTGGKLMDKAKDDTNKGPYATTEQAVQKLQMNSSVSIIPKKKAQPMTVDATDESTTIDLSNDDDPQEVNSNAIEPKNIIKQIKCPMKSCKEVFSDSLSLRKHARLIHQMQQFRCTICFARFATSDAVKLHLKKIHPNKVKAPANLAIPIVDFNSPMVRKTMSALGFTNFIPIGNSFNGSSEVFGLPVINIDGPSIENLKNLFSTETLKILPINSMQPIQKSNVPPLDAKTLPQSGITIKKKLIRSNEIIADPLRNS